MYFKKKYRIALWTVSCSVGLFIMLTPIILGFYTPQGPYLIPLSQKVNNTMVLGLVIAFTFPAIVEFNNYRWSRQVDRNLPRLLRDIAEAVRSGITLPRALEEASQRDYGPLSKELENAISMFILGASWEDSLMSLAQRLRCPSALRLSTILIEAHQTGGKMIEVLDTSADLFSSLNEFKEEQNSNMKPYMMTIYMSTIIFLIIAYVVLHQFLAPLYAASSGATTEESGLLKGVLDINYYTSILFWASIIESIFGGLIAGKIGDRVLSAGLRHSVILIIITLAVFNIPGI
ncbi:type II secretion system F family protein [Candidatus Bathyarchaeota archaeon]|nr:type II secretion system F family protein [Candidatus Bathyarchaeota archaeon]